jgi:hypothetical protein
MQPETWTLNRLAVELHRDRRTLARILESVPPVEEKRVGKRTHRAWHLADVVQRLLAIAAEATDSDAPRELSLERAKLARAQTEKSKVETEMKRAQLTSVLAGGLIPVTAARDLFGKGEILVMQGFARMAAQVPVDHFSDYRKDLAEKRGAQFRLAVMIDDWRFPVRDEFRQAAQNLLSRYHAGPDTDSTTTGDDDDEDRQD